MTLSALSAAVLTYATHSMVACALGFGLARSLQRPRDRDVLWKTVFVAPWFTTAVALVLAARLSLWPALNLSGVVRGLWAQPLPERNVVLMVYKLAGHTTIDRTVSDPVDRALSIAVSSIAALCAAIAMHRVITRYRALSRRIATRRSFIPLDAKDLDHGPRHAALIRMTISDDLPSPIALGRNEICLPRVVAIDFDEPRRAALVAHEAAHLARRDPFWFAAVDAIAALSAFQPLCRLAVRAFRHNAELVCDETALRATGDRSALIGALAALATPFDELAAVPAARSTSATRPLVARAERIASVDLDASSRRSRTALLVAAVGFIALAAVPTVRPDPRDPPLPRDLPSMRADSRLLDSMIVRRGAPRVLNVDTTLTLRR